MEVLLLKLGVVKILTDDETKKVEQGVYDCVHLWKRRENWHPVNDVQTLRPLDTETILNSVKKTNRLITVEESWPFGSVGSEIANIVQRDAFDYLDSPVIKVNSADVPMPYALSLEKLYLPQVDDIINAAKKVSYIK